MIAPPSPSHAYQTSVQALAESLFSGKDIPRKWRSTSSAETGDPLASVNQQPLHLEKKFPSCEWLPHEQSFQVSYLLPVIRPAEKGGHHDYPYHWPQVLQALCKPVPAHALCPLVRYQDVNFSAMFARNLDGVRSTSRGENAITARLQEFTRNRQNRFHFVDDKDRVRLPLGPFPCLQAVPLSCATPYPRANSLPAP